MEAVFSPSGLGRQGLAVLGFAELAMPIENGQTPPVELPTLRVAKLQQFHLEQAVQMKLRDRHHLPLEAPGELQAFQCVSVQLMVEGQQTIHNDASSRSRGLTASDSTLKLKI